MSDISILQNAGLTAPPATQARTALGQEDFLKLMITQFRNQDPFKPMENGDFLGQLAQFSTVSGISSLNDGFAGLSASMQSDQILQAASLVGHSVLASTNSAWYEQGGELKGAVELDSSASNIEVEITNGAGELVRRFDLGQQNAGLARFTWDGRDENGDKADDGHYFVTTRVAHGGLVESADTLIEAQIDSISLGRSGQGMTLNLPGGDTLPVSQVRRII
jgi:flagellar basal-body rod modification protein FlgD